MPNITVPKRALTADERAKLANVPADTNAAIGGVENLANQAQAAADAAAATNTAQAGQIGDLTSRVTTLEGGAPQQATYLGSADNPVLARGTVLTERPTTVPADRVAHVWTWVDQPNVTGLHQITAMQAATPQNVQVAIDEGGGIATVSFDGVAGIETVHFYRYAGTLPATNLPQAFAGEIPYADTTPLDGGRRSFVAPLHPTERTYRLVMQPRPLGRDTAAEAREYASEPSAEATNPADLVAPSVTLFSASEVEGGTVAVSLHSDQVLTNIEVTGLGAALTEADFAETEAVSGGYDYAATRTGLAAGQVTVTLTVAENAGGLQADPMPAPVVLTLTGVEAGGVVTGATLDYDYTQGSGASVPNAGSLGGSSTITGTFTRLVDGIELGQDGTIDSGVAAAAAFGSDGKDEPFAVYLRYRVGRMWPSGRLRGPLSVDTAASDDNIKVVADGLDQTVAAVAHSAGDVLEVLVSPDATPQASGGLIDVWTRAGGTGSWTASQVSKAAFGYLPGTIRHGGNEPDPALDQHQRLVVWPTRQTPADLASQGL